MDEEATPILKELALEEIQPSGGIPIPCKLYDGTYKGLRISVCTNGRAPDRHGNVANVGTVPATLATYAAISTFKPTLIINAGTAGGFSSKGAQIGDAFMCTTFRNHDRRISIPGYENYATGDHTATPCPNLIKYLGCKTGVVTTGNSLDAPPLDCEIMKANDASVKDMEAAAIAWVAKSTKTPFIALKIVTDIVDTDKLAHDEFLKNLATASESLQVHLSKIVEYLVTHRRL